MRSFRKGKCARKRLVRCIMHCGTGAGVGGKSNLNLCKHVHIIIQLDVYQDVFFIHFGQTRFTLQALWISPFAFPCGPLTGQHSDFSIFRDLTGRHLSDPFHLDLDRFISGIFPILPLDPPVLRAFVFSAACEALRSFLFSFPPHTPRAPQPTHSTRSRSTPRRYMLVLTFYCHLCCC